MKLNIKKFNVKPVNSKTSSQELLQAGCCCGGGGSESGTIRPKNIHSNPLIAPLKA